MIVLRGLDLGVCLSVQLDWLRVVLGKDHFKLVLKIPAHTINEDCLYR